MAQAPSILDTLASRVWHGLGQVVERADAIALVVRDTPFMTTHATALDDTRRYPPYVRRTWHFRVLETLKPDSLQLPVHLALDEAYADAAFTAHSFYHQRNLVMQSMVGWYRPSLPFDGPDTLIVFIDAYHRVGATSRYAFCVKDGFEAPGLRDSVLAVRDRQARPPVPPGDPRRRRSFLEELYPGLKKR